MTDRTLMWCDDHKEPAWLYGDGTIQCMYDLIVESNTNDHTLLAADGSTPEPPTRWDGDLNLLRDIGDEVMPLVNDDGINAGEVVHSAAEYIAAVDSRGEN